MQLINSKCLQMLIYGMEVCPLGKSDLRALDFVVDRFCMKLFRAMLELTTLEQSVQSAIRRHHPRTMFSGRYYTLENDTVMGNAVIPR